ncbi:hypothetical protein HAX54_019013 [Datura stramonium]|uniref:Uncharacterized protein n=1 Tax=Datura stramonium TaxID=4076 RepID=A0ABS8UPH0_DATST|nr:hypothetical protein [Datura stramonium]
MPKPIGLLLGPKCNDSIDEDVGINNDGNVENKANPCLNGVDTDLPSNESDRYAIPGEDDSDLHEELRSFRGERRNKRNLNPRSRKRVLEEILVGEAGIDKCFEEIGRNKKDRYVGRLGGDEH